MEQCVSALPGFNYLVRRSSHVTQDLHDTPATLTRFYRFLDISETAGIRPDGPPPPRHYARSIQLFGSSNSLCSSITESKHVVAVKAPWRRSRCKHSLGQMLRTLTRLSKLSVIRNEFARCGMLRGTVRMHDR